MNRSSARFLAYDLRPAKQAERLMLVEYLRCAAECGFKIADYRYVGMGGNRFYDFLLLHRFTGIKKMVSLEHDEHMFVRADFNRPFDFIQVRQETVGDFLALDEYQGSSIFWLDFDGGISPAMITDIQSLGVVARPNSFFFITAYGDYPKFLEELSDAARLNWLQTELGDVGSGLTQEDVQRSRAPTAIFKCVAAALRSAFAFRGDGIFDIQFSVQYSDTARMVTVGGYFGPRGSAAEIAARRSLSLPALDGAENGMFRLRNPNITERERHLFDLASTSNDRRRKEWKKLQELGFGEDEIGAYKALLRFTPRYVESIL